MSYAVSLALAVHDKVYHLVTAECEEPDVFEAYSNHAKALETANREQERFRDCLEMCLVNDIACSYALERISKCRDHRKVVAAALGCFEKSFHRKKHRRSTFRF